MTAVAVESPGIVSGSVELPASPVLAAIRATALAAGTDDSLPILTAIKVTLLERGIVLVATDRYRLSEARTGLGDEIGTVLVRAKDLATFARSLKVPKGYGAGTATVSFTIEGDTFTVSGLGVSRTFPVIEGTYPPHAHFFDYPESAVSVIGFSPVYLADGADACRLMCGGERSVPARLSFRGEAKPVIMSPATPFEGWTFQYLLMPMRFGS